MNNRNMNDEFAFEERYLHALTGDLQDELNSQGYDDVYTDYDDIILRVYSGDELLCTVALDDMTWDFQRIEDDVQYILDVIDMHVIDTATNTSSIMMNPDVDDDIVVL